MGRIEKFIANPASTGGLGHMFENKVQSSFVLLMIAGGYIPCLPAWPIHKVKLQGRYQGSKTDDFIVYTENPATKEKAKLLGQINRHLTVTLTDNDFKKTIAAAWRDFTDPELFNEGLDSIVLVTGPLSLIDTTAVRVLIQHAKYAEDSEDFICRITHTNFSSDAQRTKFEVFKAALQSANSGNALSDDMLWRFFQYLNGHGM